MSGFSTAILMHEWPREQANLHASKQIILQIFSWVNGLNIYLNLTTYYHKIIGFIRSFVQSVAPRIRTEIRSCVDLFALGVIHACEWSAVEKPNPPVFSFKFQGIFNSSVFSEITEHTERKIDNFYEWTDAKFKTIFVNRIRSIRRRRLTSIKT